MITPRAFRIRHLAVLSAAAALSATASVGVPASASAAAAGQAARKLTLTYPVTGSTYLKAPNATAALGPGTLKATINLKTDRLRAALSLPPATVSFKAFGVIPVTAVTAFIPDGPTTGKANLKTGAVKATSKMTLQITQLSMGPLPIPVGNSCETQQPAVVRVKSAPGFNPLAGGNLTGTYTIPQFAHCNGFQLLINPLTAGPGNTITLTLGQAKTG